MADPVAPAPAAPAPVEGAPPAAAPVTTPAAAPGTIAAAAPGDPPALGAPVTGDLPPAGPTFPDNWREEMAGGDEKFMAVLKRYASPKSFAEGAWNLRRRHDAGEFKRPLGENPTPDEIKQFREENGVPADAAGYAVPDGLKLSEIDKPIIDGFRQFAHAQNMPAGQFGQVVDWYYNAQAAANERMVQRDHDTRQKSDDLLRAEWGKDFRPNIQALNNFIDGTAPQGFAARLLGGRLADGTIMGNDPEVLRWLAQLGRANNPLASIVGPGGGGSAASAEARLAEIGALMGDRDSKYWKGPEAEAMQKEWRDLKTALDAGRSKAA